MNNKQFIENVTMWATVRGIYEHSTEEKQVEKFCDELKEYLTAKTEDDEMDGIGDMAVCLVNAGHFKGGVEFSYMPDDGLLYFIKAGLYGEALGSLDDLCDSSHSFRFADCLDMAWNEIKDRKGLMVGGLFVKWENLSVEQKKVVIQREEDFLLKNS